MLIVDPQGLWDLLEVCENRRKVESLRQYLLPCYGGELSHNLVFSRQYGRSLTFGIRSLSWQARDFRIDLLGGLQPMKYQWNDSHF